MTAMNKPLTKLQMETLALIHAGKISQHKYGYAAWRILGGNPSTVGRLVSMGLAVWGKSQDDDVPITLTNAGRSALVSPATDDSQNLLSTKTSRFCETSTVPALRETGR